MADLIRPRVPAGKVSFNTAAQIHSLFQSDKVSPVFEINHVQVRRFSPVVFRSWEAAFNYFKALYPTQSGIPSSPEDDSHLLPQQFQPANKPTPSLDDTTAVERSANSSNLHLTNMKEGHQQQAEEEEEDEDEHEEDEEVEDEDEEDEDEEHHDDIRGNPKETAQNEEDEDEEHHDDIRGNPKETAQNEEEEVSDEESDEESDEAEDSEIDGHREEHGRDQQETDAPEENTRHRIQQDGQETRLESGLDQGDLHAGDASEAAQVLQTMSLKRKATEDPMDYTREDIIRPRLSSTASSQLARQSQQPRAVVRDGMSAAADNIKITGLDGSATKQTTEPPTTPMEPGMTRGILSTISSPRKDLPRSAQSIVTQPLTMSLTPRTQSAGSATNFAKISAAPYVDTTETDSAETTDAEGLLPDFWYTRVAAATTDLSQRKNASPNDSKSVSLAIKFARSIGSETVMKDWQNYFSLQDHEPTTAGKIPTRVSDTIKSTANQLAKGDVQLAGRFEQFGRTWAQIDAGKAHVCMLAATYRYRMAELYESYQGILHAFETAHIDVGDEKSGVKNKTRARDLLFLLINPHLATIDDGAALKAKISDNTRDFKSFTRTLDAAHRWYQIKQRWGWGVLAFVTEEQVTRRQIEGKELKAPQFKWVLDHLAEINPTAIKIGKSMELWAAKISMSQFTENAIDSDDPKETSQTTTSTDYSALLHPSTVSSQLSIRFPRPSPISFDQADWKSSQWQKWSDLPEFIDLTLADEDDKQLSGPDVHEHSADRIHERQGSVSKTEQC